MKILFDHPTPFALAHGGFQTQIEQTKAALENGGVDVEWVRWWDDKQKGDLVHYFGRPAPSYVHASQKKGMKVIMAELLSGLGVRSASARTLQRAIISVLKRSSMFGKMGWQSYEAADAVVALTPWEASLMSNIFGAPPERVHVVPNGVEREFLESREEERGHWLVSTVTITECKRPLELARAAVEARVPVWIIGRPYSEADGYYLEFLRFSKQHGDLIRYEGPISSRQELARVYRQARGFVLLSTMESLSLAALEAAACKCPLLLSDLPWARTTFKSEASYSALTGGTAGTGRHLKEFYERAPHLPLPQTPAGWETIGQRLRAVYESVLSTSR